jgi:putative nucleotidyltransferase-like protein
MDLASEVQRLFLDVLAVDLTQCLRRAGIPHALLKGPSTATWLYDPPRSYCDVDVLVPLSRVSEVRTALESARLAYACAGRVGEEAQHSLLMLSPTGCPVDVHVSLPAIPPAGDKPWEVLAPHVQALDLGIGAVPALDEPARCLILALHALGSGPCGHPAQDLRRARAVTTHGRWREARDLARALNAEDLFLAGLSSGDAGSSRVVLSRRAHLYVTGAPSEALALQRLRDARRRDAPKLLWREVFPSPGFMRHAYPYARDPVALARAYMARWRRIGANLPSAIREWRRAARFANPARPAMTRGHRRPVRSRPGPDGSGWPPHAEPPGHQELGGRPGRRR